MLFSQGGAGYGSASEPPQPTLPFFLRLVRWLVNLLSTDIGSLCVSPPDSKVSVRSF